MLILLFVVFAGMYYLASRFIDTRDIDFFRLFAQAFIGIGEVDVVLAIVTNSCHLSEMVVLDPVIAMYEEENRNIESQIDAIVSGYMTYEGETFKKAKEDSAISLVSLYPELKSDGLVQSQIAIYQANNEKIKELKEKKIKAGIYRWWLYFGK